MNKSFKHFLSFSFLIAALLFMNACSSDNTDPEPEPDPEVPSNKTPFLKKAGGAQDDHIAASLTDDKGNLYVTGAFKVSATFGNTTITSQGGLDAFVAKYNTNGDLLWLIPIGGAQYSYGRALAFDKSGNICFVGEFNGTITFAGTSLTAFGQYNTVIARFSPAGELVSAIKDGTGGTNSGQYGLTWPRAVTFDASNNMYITGSFYYEVVFGSTTLLGDVDIDGQMFTVKYNVDGTVDWVKKGDGATSGVAIAVNPEGTLVYITGSLYGTANLGATQLTSKGDGDALLVGYQTEDGDVNSAEIFGGVDEDAGTDLGFDQSGQIFLCGYFQDEITLGKYTLETDDVNDIFLFRVGTGTYNWARQLKTYSMVNDLVMTNNGIFLTGWFVNTATFGSTPVASSGSLDAFAARFTLGGTCNWYGIVGGTYNEHGESIAVDALGNVFMTGNFVSTATYGDKSITSSGSTDGLLVKMPTN